MFVLTLDQRDSTHSSDAVPEILRALSAVPCALPFERTAGDEIQGLFSSADDVLRAAVIALRDGRFAVGIGVGDVSMPLPASTREATGSAYTAAREAVEEAKGRDVPLALVEHRGGQRRGTEAGARLDALLWPVGYLVGRRSEKQWAALDALACAGTQRDAALALGKSPQAMSRMLADARDDEVSRGLSSLSHLLRRLDEKDGGLLDSTGS